MGYIYVVHCGPPATGFSHIVAIIPPQRAQRGPSNRFIGLIPTSSKGITAMQPFPPLSVPRLFLLILAILLGTSISLAAQEAADTESAKAADQAGKAESKPAAKPSNAAGQPDRIPHEKVLKDAQAIQGLIKLYRKNSKVFGELSSSDYGKEYIVLISIARGIGRGWLVGGMSWNDDWVWTFRKVDDRVHIIRKNVRFRAAAGTPEATAVTHAYTDSVLFSLPVVTKGPNGGDLIDLTSVFMSDLPQISHALPGFTFSQVKSSWASVKGFEQNIELQVAATYSSSGRQRLESVADSRGVTVNVHYSISRLPKTGYTPRLADDRVGFFLTVIKDYSRKNDQEQFARHINRWHLEKADSSANISPPKTPIIFYIENTVPYKYRHTIRSGILEWNKAFEQAGFVDAIEVHQQPDNAEWDPEDVRYNTIRWMTSQAPFSGIGPSRVNPYTGQILDADILLNSDTIQFYEYHFETLTPESIADATGGPLDLDSYRKESEDIQLGRAFSSHRRCRRAWALSRELAFSRSILTAQEDEGADKSRSEAMEKLILQALKGMVMHEIGHTLGLRHNFKASTYLNLQDINDPEKSKAGMLASVMDYDPANIVPKVSEQGDYFTPTIGPYDIWAITYGYSSHAGGTNGEKEALNQIASRSGEPGLAYATDEDTRGVDPDPNAGIMDLGDDAIAFAQVRSELIQQAISGVVDRMVEPGDSYAQSRRAFNSLLHHYGVAMYHVSRYIGGIYVSRSHKGDKEAPHPLEIVDVEKQRAALDFLEEHVFGKSAYHFSPEMYNLMLSSRWYHWGTIRTERPDYPIHDGIIGWQGRILNKLLSPLTLSRIHDNELKVNPEQDAMTTAELIERLTKSIFSEVDEIKEGEFSNRQPAVNSLRRNLQRVYLKQLSNVAMGNTAVPQDCQAIAFAELSALEARIENLKKSNVNLDGYSRAHLAESASRIRKVLEASLSLDRP